MGELKTKGKIEMELKVIQPTFPEIIEFNFDELKEEIQKKASEYMNLVYSEDQIQDAKKDVATLRKFVKALSDERIKVKKECLKPYEDFEAKIKVLSGIVDGAIQNIDGQVKAAEEKKKAEKLENIKEYWTNTEIRLPIPLTLEQIFNEKWLNASVSMKTVCAEIDARLEQIAKNLETLSNLPEFSFEATEEYKQSLDLNKAITEGQRMLSVQKKKQEEQKAEKSAVAYENKPTGSADKMWVCFKAYLSTSEAAELKNFFDNKGIAFKPI
jgi:hypothetical protein